MRTSSSSWRSVGSSMAVTILPVTMAGAYRVPRPAGHVHRGGPARARPTWPTADLVPMRVDARRAGRRRRRARSTSASCRSRTPSRAPSTSRSTRWSSSTTLLIQREVVMRDPAQPAGAARARRSTDVQHGRVDPARHAQCRAFFARELPGVELVAANSTAEAARTSASTGRPDTAAVGTALAAKLYGLEVLAADIEDHPDNSTRFVLVAAEGGPAADRPRQDEHRVLPAHRPARQPARHPRPVHGPQHQPHQARVAPDQAGPRQTTASSSTSRATSPTRSWPTACATCTPSWPGVKFLGSYPRRRRARRRHPPRRRRLLAGRRRLDLIPPRPRLRPTMCRCQLVDSTSPYTDNRRVRWTAKHAGGGVAERPKALALKAVGASPAGSNPAPSALCNTGWPQERCESGRIGRTANALTFTRGPRVQIPPSPRRFTEVVRAGGCVHAHEREHWPSQRQPKAARPSTELDGGGSACHGAIAQAKLESLPGSGVEPARRHRPARDARRR